jgi:hypothetical protein
MSPAMTLTTSLTTLFRRKKPRRPTIADLPNELLLDIACYLPLGSLISLLNVNYRWRAVVTAAAEVGVSETTKQLLKAWVASTSMSQYLPSTAYTQEAFSTTRAGAERRAKDLTAYERDRYVSLVGRYAFSYKNVTHEEAGLSQEFLEWLYEWPARAAVPLLPLPSTATKAGQPIHDTGFLSPLSVIDSIIDSASYHTTQPIPSDARNIIRPSYYYQERIIFLISLEEGEILLPRIKLVEGVTRGDTQKKIKCSLAHDVPLNFASFGGDWARFLPISTMRKNKNKHGSSSEVTDNNGDVWEVAHEPPAPVPLYVLSGCGLGRQLAGSVCMLGPDAVLTVVAKTWAEYLVKLAETKGLKLMFRAELERYQSMKCIKSMDSDTLTVDQDDISVRVGRRRQVSSMELAQVPSVPNNITVTDFIVELLRVYAIALAAALAPYALITLAVALVSWPFTFFHATVHNVPHSVLVL